MINKYQEIVSEYHVIRYIMLIQLAHTKQITYGQ